MNLAEALQGLSPAKGKDCVPQHDHADLLTDDIGILTRAGGDPRPRTTGRDRYSSMRHRPGLQAHHQAASILSDDADRSIEVAIDEWKVARIQMHH